MDHNIEGILLVDKPIGITSFDIVRMLRRKLNVKKIGHAGTLDPFATGLMVMLVGRKYTRMSDAIMAGEKEYIATARLGITTDSYDCDGKETKNSDIIPIKEDIEKAVDSSFQGTIQQIPPMFSAKKIGGKKLYELARKGEEIERKPHNIDVTTKILSYQYPILTFHVQCSKGTYIRSIANDLGDMLGCGAHLTALRRTRCGEYSVENSVEVSCIKDEDYDISQRLIIIGDDDGNIS
ncbi:MAG: tRNA pseudouridine(55) synthase TruB [Waddliaceae bacterium]|nr:tRNA pseudouridine(55) synthase TruB [Waddliaceae bacterium]